MPTFLFIVEIRDYRNHRIGAPPPLEIIRVASLKDALDVRRQVLGDGPRDPDLLVHVRPAGELPRRAKSLLPGVAWSRARKGDRR